MPSPALHHNLAEVAGACYCIAAADGHVTPEEVEAMAQAIAKASGGTASFEQAMSLIKQTHLEVSKLGRAAYLKGLGKDLEPDERREVLAAAAATMIADGEAADVERDLYLEIAKELGFEEADAEDLIHELAEAKFDDR